VTVTIGSLCTGYCGLDTAVEHVTGGRTVWHCEIEDAPSRLLAHRFPDVPNHRDLKTLAWAEHPVDVLTGGYPCQPFSGAGLRKGTDDPRHLFPWIALGIGLMRPPLVLLENVRGHLSLGFDVVLAQFDRLGYDIRWTLFPASKVGAPHGRSRLWIAARAREVGGWSRPGGEPTAYADDAGGWSSPQVGLFGDVDADKIGPAGVMVEGARWDRETTASPIAGLLRTPTAQLAINGGSQHPDKRKAGGHGPTLADEIEYLLPTPSCTDGMGGHLSRSGDRGDELLLPGVAKAHASGLLLPTPTTDPASHNGHARDLGSELRLLPTPAVNDMGEGKTVDAWDAWTAQQREKHGNGNGHGPSLAIEAARLSLLPTPTTMDSHASGGGYNGQTNVTLTDATVRHPERWGIYAAAIARWEALTRPAPAPTQPGRSGPRLSPAFVEWLMGLPAGWVTDVPGLTRNHMLTMLGNGVVPQCAAAAYTLLGISPDLFREAAA
jgi:DNA (cytosine-5)-methyltransferase 1